MRRAANHTEPRRAQHKGRVVAAGGCLQRGARAALRARTRKLLASRRWPAVHLHGLGAAIAPTIVLAGELVEASNGQLVASCSTSTEVLVDRGEASDLPAPAEREKILLIDEVDVFFSDAFYGATYSPVTPFRTPNTSSDCK